MSLQPPPDPATPLRRSSIRWLAVTLIAIVTTCGLSPAPRADAQSAVASAALREHAAARGFLVGTAVATGPLAAEAPYRETLVREFNVVTAENAMKWDATEPSRGQYTFSGADAVVSFAESSDQAVHGHTLVWHSQTPGWVQGLPASEMRTAMQQHIASVVGRYRGRVASWDVVNEVFAENGSLRTSFWHQTLGPSYIAEAFRAARQADPGAKLFINDYNVEGQNAKSNGLYNLVRDLRADGVPIDGVGLQAHLTVGQVPGDMQQNIARFAALGVDVRITELDIRMPLPADATKLARQADDYRRVFDACLAVPRCTAITIWGFTDKHSWIPNQSPGYGAALPFDESYRPKPAYDAIHAALAGGQGGNPGGTACTTAMNSAHVQAGRATAWLVFVWARGSNQYLGLTWSTTSLREGPAGTWTMVSAC
jgi:endo-1,4-beta-xylanase